MGFSTSISRFVDYRRRNGLRATIRRIGLAAKRALFSSRSVLFYCDLSTLASSTTDLPGSLKVERKTSETEISLQDLQQITSLWNPKLARRNIQERFGLGASLWLIKFEAQLAGYGWTLQGRTVEPHYFPLGQRDVQFLDFHVFPKFRGRAMDWVLMTHILHTLAAEGAARAFGEAAEWNQASLSSFAMNSFRRLGSARKFTICGHAVVLWAGSETVQHRQKVKMVSLPPSTGKSPTSPICTHSEFH
jgi:ribosomal protein S18 acetylase RimI-like enzyme